MTSRVRERAPNKNPNRGRNGSTSWLWKPTRYSILFRDEWRCVYCALALTYETATVDHLIPISKGGTDHHTNLVAACKRCNSVRRDRTVLDFVRHHVAGNDAARTAAQIFRQAKRPLDREAGRVLAAFARALKAVA